MNQQTLSHTFRTVAWLVALLAVSSAHGADELRWQFAQGDRYAVTLNQETAITTIVKTKPVRFTLDISLEMNWRVVESVPQQSASVEQTFERIVVAMNSPGGDPIEYDSNSKQLSRKQKSFAAAFAPLVGESLTLTVSPRGVVEAVALSDELKEHLAEVGAESRLAELLSEKGLGELLRGSLIQLPADAVAAGDKWSDEDSVASSLGKLKRTRNYTYAGAGDIDLSAEVEIAASGGPKIDIKQQSQTGKFKFDVVAGRIASSEITQSLTTETPYRDLRIQTTVETTQKMTVTLLP